MNKLQIKRVKKLIDTLRSNQFKQGRGQLRDENDCYCCLGVACAISRLGKWKLEKIQGVDQWEYLGDGAHMPEKVRKYYGFTNSVGRFEHKHNNFFFHNIGSLTMLNDNGRSFESIADQIEYCLEHPESGMFV